MDEEAQEDAEPVAAAGGKVPCPPATRPPAQLPPGAQEAGDEPGDEPEPVAAAAAGAAAAGAAGRPLAVPAGQASQPGGGGRRRREQQEEEAAAQGDGGLHGAHSQGPGPGPRWGRGATGRRTGRGGGFPMLHPAVGMLPVERKVCWF